MRRIPLPGTRLRAFDDLNSEAFRINSVSVPIASIPPEEFMIALSSRIFTDEEIAYWIQKHRLSAGKKLELLKAIAKLKGERPITGIIRTNSLCGR